MRRVWTRFAVAASGAGRGAARRRSPPQRSSSHTHCVALGTRRIVGMRFRHALALACVLLGALEGSARAGTVGVLGWPDPQVRYVDRSGAANTVVVMYEGAPAAMGERIVMTVEDAAGVQSGPGCTQQSST